MSKKEFNYYELLDERNRVVDKFKMLSEIIKLLQGRTEEFPQVLMGVVKLSCEYAEELTDIDTRIIDYNENHGIQSQSISYIRR